jgi:hypothetical protein
VSPGPSVLVLIYKMLWAYLNQFSFFVKTDGTKTNTCGGTKSALCYVVPCPCQNGPAHPQVADGADGLLDRRVVVNIVVMQQGAAVWRWGGHWAKD